MSAYAIPLGAQNYSLAVQGAFTGQLESSYNPGWGGQTLTPCSLPVTTITAGPPTVSNASRVFLTFSASTGQCSVTCRIMCTQCKTVLALEAGHG